MVLYAMRFRLTVNCYKQNLVTNEYFINLEREGFYFTSFEFASTRIKNHLVRNTEIA
jgi:hypothetical protein